MSLSRTETKVRLKSTDDLFYDVRMVDKGEGVIIPEPDDTTGAAGVSDGYVSLIGDDDQIYRWSLQSNEVSDEDGNWTEIESVIALADDQGEDALDGLDLKLGDDWYRVIVELQADGDGEMIPTLTTTDGEPWTGPTNRITGRFGARWSVPVFGARWAN